MPSLPKGIYTALITPFDEEGHLDEKGLRELIEEQIEARISALVLLGTTGEAPALEEAEEERIIQIGRASTKHHLPLIVGVGSPSTERSLKKLQRASSLGADAALVVTPYYSRPTQEGLYRHFKSLLDSSTLPLILYNIPSRTGVHLELETLKRLCPHPLLAGVKECSPSLSHFMHSLRTFGEELMIFSGDDPLAYTHLTLGAAGLISVASNLLPRKMVKLVELIDAKRFEEALSLQMELLPLLEALFIETNPAPIKRALQLLGRPAGEPRLPLVALSPENTKLLQKLL